MASTTRPRRKTRADQARPAKKRVRGSGADTVYEELRRDILSLRMEPGTLLDETELAARFNLSRSPIREALIRLSAEGLVQTLRNRSSIVAPFDVAAIPSFLDATELLYRLTTRLAAANCKPSQLASILAIHREHSAATKRGDMAAMIRLNRDFHLEIARASGNSLYVTWMRQVLDQGQRILGLYLHDVADRVDEDLERHWLDTHYAIVRAIENQDADAAEVAARKDFETLSTRMQEQFSARPSAAMTLAPQAARRKR